MANQYGGGTGGLTAILSGTPNSIIGATTKPAAKSSPASDATTTAPAAQPNIVNATNNNTPIYTGPTPAQVATAKATADFNSNKTNVLNSVGDAVNSGAAGYKGSILDYVDSRRQSQNNIDNDAVQNELAREQGMKGVNDMVGNGIKSGGVILANDGAGSSSAGEAIAKAYGTIGRQQASSVGNQAAQGQNKVNTEESNLGLQDATEARHTQEDKANIINTIVTNARQSLGLLNQQAQYASIPDRIDIENQIAQIHQQALDALSAYDSELSQGMAGQPALDANGVRAKASALLTAGTAPESSFDYTTDVPTSLQGTGQFASSLPIFVAPKKNT